MVGELKLIPELRFKQLRFLSSVTLKSNPKKTPKVEPNFNSKFSSQASENVG